MLCILVRESFKQTLQPFKGTLGILKRLPPGGGAGVQARRTSSSSSPWIHLTCYSNEPRGRCRLRYLLWTWFSCADVCFWWTGGFAYISLLLAWGLSVAGNCYLSRTSPTKCMSWWIHITYETLFTLRRSTVNTLLQPHQILRLPRKMNLMMDPHHLWNVIYTARSNSLHPPTSRNTAPATQNDHPTSGQKFAENKWNAISNARPIREWSDHDPRMIRPWTRQSATCRATEVTFHTRQERILLKITTFPAPAIIPNFT